MGIAVKLANNTELLHFTQPEHSFGQKVKTEDGYIGYIVGLDFYPETSTWSYGVYLLYRKQELSEEIWYEANQLEEIWYEANQLKVLNSTITTT